MPSREQPLSGADYERLLGAALDSLGQRLGPHDRYKAQKHIDAAEYRLALERIADGLCDDDVAITHEERDQLLQLAQAVDSDDAASAIELCPEAPSWRNLTWWDAFVDVGRRLGHGIFYAVMAVVFVVSVGLGVAGVKDMADQQPVLWGTFTEEDCLPNIHGCRSIGRWVSDDGTIVKEQIYLDGSPGKDGTVRASYQPAGLNNDSDNNIVHVRWTTGAGIWMPWVLAAFSLGSVVYYNRQWRRGKSSQG